MVNFDNEVTVGTPAIDIVRVLVLQAQSYCHDAWEDYRKKQDQGIEIGLSVVKSRLFTYWMKVQQVLSRKKEPEKFVELKKMLNSDNETELLALTEELDNLLDELRITRLDIRVHYNRQSIETENMMHGL